VTGPGPGPGPGPRERGGAGPDDARRIIDEATRLIDALGGMPAGHTGAECRRCPVCRVMATLRELRPEVLEHLSLAATEMLAAVREFAATVPAPSAAAPGSPPGSPSGVPATYAGPDAEPDAEPDAGPDAELVPRPTARRTSNRPVVQHIEITD